MSRGPCKIDQVRNPSRFIARVDGIAADGDSPEEAARILAERLEEQARRIRLWILG